MYDSRNLDALLKDFAAKSVPGCACVVTQGDETVYEGYHGYADLETRRLMDSGTVFRLYSMTKVAIATACLMLYEQGKLLLNDPLYEYFPEYRHSMKCIKRADGGEDVVPVEQPILVKHALSMSCGLPYGTSTGSTENLTLTEREMQRVNRELHQRGHYTLREDIYESACVPLAFEPGTHWLYGFGSELSAGLIELITGKNIEDALRGLLFEPLGMASTGMRFFGDIQARLSTLYTCQEDGRLVPSPFSAFDEKHLPGKEHEFGCPRLFTTARDFAALSQMLACGGIYQGERIMGRKTIDLLRANQLNEQQLKDIDSAYMAGYGYSFCMRTMMAPGSGCANSSEGEFGWVGGSGTWVAMDPSERFSVVYMHQMLPSKEYYHHLRVRAAAFGGL